MLCDRHRMCSIILLYDLHRMCSLTLLHDLHTVSLRPISRHYANSCSNVREHILCRHYAYSAATTPVGIECVLLHYYSRHYAYSVATTPVRAVCDSASVSLTRTHHPHPIQNAHSWDNNGSPFKNYHALKPGQYWIDTENGLVVPVEERLPPA